MVLKFFVKFRICGPQRFFSITHGPLFLNFHAKSSEEQKKKGHHVPRCPIRHNSMERFIRNPRPLCGPPETLCGHQEDRGPQFENHCVRITSGHAFKMHHYHVLYLSYDSVRKKARISDFNPCHCPTMGAPPFPLKFWLITLAY